MSRSYQDFQPDCLYKEGEEHDIIEFQLKDFRKDQLKVHFGSNGVLTVSGERPLDRSKWVRFHKEFTTPKDCKPTEIQARFSTSLYITIPKKIMSPHVSQQDPPPSVEQETVASRLSPVREEGKRKQSNNISDSREVAEETITSAISAKRSITWLMEEGETVMKIGASLLVSGMMFIVLFYVFKIQNIRD